ncbi:putative ribonuclease H-like domain-containing protein [Tanacetum coccineum]
MVYGSNYNMVNYNYTTKRTLPNAQRNMVPRAVLMKTGLNFFNTARTVNTTHPKSTVFSAKPMSCFPKTAQSIVRRPFQSKTTLTNKRFRHKVNTTKAQAVNTTRPQAVNIARPKTVKTARPNSPVVNVVKVNHANVVKASACWVWRPTKPNGASITLKKHNYIDARGRSKSLSINFKEIFNEVMYIGRKGAHSCRILVLTDGVDKKNYVLFTDTECLVLSPNFKLLDENQILKIPRKDNVYSFDMKNIVPKETLTCLVAKATSDESMLGYEAWKQQQSSFISQSSDPIDEARVMLTYGICLVFFLTTKDETSEILKNFIKEIENLVDKKVKIIRTDNGTKFKNKVMDDFCREKGIKREYSVARTPQQNSVAERRNRTLIEAARTMLANSKLPTTFWADAVILLAMYKTGSYLGMFDGKSDKGTQGEISIGYAVGQHINTVNPDVNTGSSKLNTVDPSVNTASSHDQDSPKDMFTMGASHTLEATHVEFFRDVYVITPGFKDPDHPDKVYKVVKALYGLHQAPRAWEATYVNVGDEAVHKELGDRMERTAYCSLSSRTEQDNGNIIKTNPMATLNESSPSGNCTFRCKSVWKSWKSLISHPRFVKAHHRRQVNLIPYRMGDACPRYGGGALHG